MPRNKDSVGLRFPLSVRVCIAVVSLSFTMIPTFGGESDVIVKANSVHTMNGSVLSPGMILIRDGKIAQVAESIEIETMPTTVEVRHVMPGLVNAQSTAGLVGSGGEASREVTPEFETAGMIDFDARDFLEAVDGGETTLHLMPSTENVIAGWTCLVKASGGEPSERFLETRKGVAISMCSDPAGRNRSRSRPDSIYVRQPTNRMGVVWILRNQLQRARTPSGGEAGNATGPLVKMLAGKVTAFGVSRTSFDIQTLLTISDEFDFDPIVVGGQEAYDVLDELADSGAPVIYTGVSPGVFGREGSELFWATPVRLSDKDIPFCIAGDGLLERMRLAVRFGLTPEQAMASVTADAAEVLGIDKRVGKIAVGYDADLLGFSGPPAEMTSSLDWVMINGQDVTSSKAAEED
ncbi:MAG: amidohydrolase family protein [Planctomycetota bacterium]